jgi:hypothetical protein
MDRRKFITGTAAGAAASAPALSSADDRHGASLGIVGSWFATVTAVDPPLGQFNDLISFHAGGVVTESRRYSVPATPFGPLLETTGHGAWKSTGRRTFEAFFRFLLQNTETAAPVGTDNIRLVLTLDRSGRRLTGTFRSRIKDMNDAVVFTVTGDYSATPITA